MPDTVFVLVRVRRHMSSQILVQFPIAYIAWPHPAPSLSLVILRRFGWPLAAAAVAASALLISCSA